MLRVGLTGGYASGKSSVARELERLGCRVIYADALGHRVLMPDGASYQAAVDLFGEGILNADGTIDRKKLAAIVFADAAKLTLLNEIVHPAVWQLEDALLREFELKQPRGIAVIEAAILIETGGNKKVHKLIVTVCGQENQIARAIERDHISADEATARIRRQISDEERVRLADYIIHTDGTREETAGQVQQVFSELRQFS